MKYRLLHFYHMLITVKTTQHTRRMISFTFLNTVGARWHIETTNKLFFKILNFSYSFDDLLLAA
jgi:hypothetical protein